MSAARLLWGTSESGFQFEMGDPQGLYVDEGTDWYAWTHSRVARVRGLVSGDLPEHGPDYWELYPGDHGLLEGLGATGYRLGVEWSRIFPVDTGSVQVDVEEQSGRPVAVHVSKSVLWELDSLADQDAVEHYRAVLGDLRDRGIEPIVTLIHFSLPRWLHDPLEARRWRLHRGRLGLLDSRFPVEAAKYAAYVAWRLSDLVDVWVTINEPVVAAELAYLWPRFPPAVFSIGAYKRAVMNLLHAHAAMYRAVKRHGSRRASNWAPEAAWVGIVQHMVPVQPYRVGRRLDEKAAGFVDRMHNRWFLDALVYGRLDAEMRGEGWVAAPRLRGLLDWIGVNYYTRAVVKGCWVPPFAPLPVYPCLVDGYGLKCRPGSTSRDGRPVSDYGWEHYPEGLEAVLRSAAEYGLPLIVTENGVADARDALRPRFIREHVAALRRAAAGGVDVRGYLYWALTDNYEWSEGFRMRFGLYHVDYTSKERRPRREGVDAFKREVERGLDA